MKPYRNTCVICLKSCLKCFLRCSSSSAGLDKRVVQVYQRIQKHMASSSPHLVDQAWGRVKAQCTEKWAAMELQMKQVFGVVIAPSAGEVKKQFEIC